MKERSVDQIDTIVIHHSASDFGNFDEIDNWHKAKGWDMCGYNSIILNCYPTQESFLKRMPDVNSDGQEEEGRDIKYIPAGVRGHNAHTVHICLIGNRTYKSAQLITLRTIVEYYRGFIPSIRKVVQHSDLDDRKSQCAGLSSKFLKELLV